LELKLHVALQDSQIAVKFAHMACTRLLSECTQWWVEPLIASVSFTAWMNLFALFEKESSSAFVQRLLAVVQADMPVLCSYWAGVYAWIALVDPPAGVESGCPESPSDSLLLFAETAGGLVAYDFLFFWLHLAMHCWPWFGRLLDHARHHDRDDTGASVQAQGSAFRTVRHSFVDGALQVFVNICVQRHTVWGSPKSRLARWLHNILVTMLLSEVRMQPRALPGRGILPADLPAGALHGLAAHRPPAARRAGSWRARAPPSSPPPRPPLPAVLLVPRRRDATIRALEGKSRVTFSHASPPQNETGTRTGKDCAL